MAAAKINTHWDEDIYGNSILVVEKERAKLNFDEVADLLRYDWKLQGHYVMHDKCDRGHLRSRLGSIR